MSKVTFRSKQPYFQLSYMDVFKVGFITVPVVGRDHSKHIEELKRKYGGDEDPEYSDLDRKLIAKFRQ